MKRSAWNSLRTGVLAGQGNRCGVCRSESKLSCHEAWEYDDENKIQRLGGFEAVCALCHHVTHFGKAKLLSADRRIDLEAVINHFMTVNGTSRETFEAHRDDAFRIWRERSQYEWQTDLGDWASLIKPQTA
jgi:hypothetical protein